MKLTLLKTLPALILLVISQVGFSQAPNLGAASDFAVFTSAGAFNVTGASTSVTGDVGTNVGAFNGFPPGVLVGDIHVADATSEAAATDVTAAYGSLNTVTCGILLTPTLGNGQTLFPNVYCVGQAATVNGDLILDAQNDSDAIFILKIDGALATNVNSNIILTNGASLCNVYWQVNGQVDLGENSAFEGTLLVNGAINLLDGASLTGQALSQTGAIALQNNMVTIGMPAVASSITASGPTGICAGEMVTLSGNVGGTWNTGSTASEIVVSTSGDYFVTNTSNCGTAMSNVIAVSANEPLTITCPADLVVECDDSTSPENTGFASAESGCGNITITFVDTISEGFCPDSYNIERTWTAVDEDGNEASCVQMIEVVDSERPVITEISDITLTGCAEPWPTVSTVWTDNCSEGGNIDGVPGSVETTSCGQYRDYSFIVSDDCGNSSTPVIVRVNRQSDETNPEITDIADYSLEGCNAEWPSFLTTTWTDNCAAGGSINSDAGVSDGTSVDGCIQYRLYTFNVTDDCGNSDTETVRVSRDYDVDGPIIDLVDPQFAGLMDGDSFEVQCYGQDSLWQLPEGSVDDVTVSDNCVGAIAVDFASSKVADGNCPEDGFMQRFEWKWTATDDCGNESTLSLFLLLVDTIDPVLYDIPADTTVFCDQLPEPSTLVYALDECLCADIEYSETAIPNDVPSQKIVERTWTATDCCGNMSMESQTITVLNDESPSLSVLLPDGTLLTEDGALEFDCNDGGVPLAFESLSASNGQSTVVCGGEATIQLELLSSTSGYCDNKVLETYVYEWTATDDFGNIETIALTIRIIDTTPPVIVNFVDVICSNDPNPPFIYALDNCTNATLEYYEYEVQGDYGTEIERAYTAADACGNLITLRQRIIPSNQGATAITWANPILENVTAGDTIELSCSLNENGSYSGFVVDDANFASDLGEDLLTSFDETLMESLGCEGEQAKNLMKLTWSAVNWCGNSSEMSIYAYISDNVAPTLVDFKAEMTLSCMGDIPEILAVDNCGLVIQEIDETRINGECANNFDIIRSIKLTDECGNTMVTSQTIHMIDNVGPKIYGIEKYVCEDAAIPNAYAIDACYNDTIGVTMVEDTIVNELCDSSFQLKRVWTATDACGNSTTVEQFVVFSDQSAPEVSYSNNLLKYISGPNEVFMADSQAMADMNNIDWYNILGFDQCLGRTIFPEFTISSEFADDCLLAGYYEIRTFKWVISDVCGNGETITFDVRIIDDLAPELIQVPANIYYDCNEIPDTFEVVHPIFNDETDPNGGSITFEEVMEMGEVLTITRTWTAVDDCGNVTIATQEIVALINSDFACDIEMAEAEIACNSHQNLLVANVSEADGPNTYFWEIEGGECQIQSGQNNDSLYIYVGFSDVLVNLTVTDAFGCITVCETSITCTSNGQLQGRFTDGEYYGNLMISNIAPNPTSDRFVLGVLSENDEVLNYHIINPTGEVMYENKVDIIAGKSNINVSVRDLPGGMYFVRVDNGKNIDMMKFIKIR